MESREQAKMHGSRVVWKAAGELAGRGWGWAAGASLQGEGLLEKQHGSELGLGCDTKGLSPHASSVGLEVWKRGKPRL